ncbi:MAG: hypothetical protein LBH25_05055 [Fibromonadaceae bacterium]|jgi:hypothetical protein|nr:hypothetical protein [Fibromonadaceae bacterium]
MRPIFKALLILQFLVQTIAYAAWSGSASTAWYTNPNASIFYISNEEDLAGLAQLVNNGTQNFANKTIELTSNLDLGNIDWTPIGKITATFQGKFNGNKHIISNLYINSTDDYQGLFGYINFGDVLNLGVEGSVTGYNYVGGAVGSMSSSTIKDCYFIGDVTAIAYAGGLLGYTTNGSKVTNSYAVAMVTGDSRVGGLYVYDTSNFNVITDSYYDGDVCTACNVRARDGRTTATEMVKQATFNAWDFTNTWAIDEGKSYPYFIGGTPYYPMIVTIPPQAHTGSPIIPASLTVTRNGTTLTQGTDYTVTYTNNTAVGIATATITGIGSYTGEKTANFNILPGWYIGKSSPYTISTADELASLAQIVNTGIDNFSGKTIELAKDLDLSSYPNWEPIGNEYGYRPFEGIFNGKGHIISNLYIYINSFDEYGHGLFGFVDGGVIENLGVEGSLFASDIMGGLVAHMFNGTIRNCYFIGDIETSNGSGVGGLVGNARGYPIIENSYAATKISNLNLNLWPVTGTEIGGLVGVLDDSDFLPTNSYYNIDLCPDTTCAANLGLDYDRTTAQMVKQATFKGWDFTNTWAIDEGKSYPYFIGGKPYYPPYIPNCTIDPIPSQTHTGSPIAPSATVVCNGTTLTKDTDYTVTYTNNTAVGIATATITGTGSYTGEKTANFNILPGWYIGKSSPYTISTAQDLASLAQIVNFGIDDFSGKTIELMNNIDLGNMDWTPIMLFRGNFDGNKHIIRNLYINEPDESGLGLFGYVEGGVIENLGVEGSLTGYSYIGGLVAESDGAVIRNSYFIGDITVFDAVAGGLVGISANNSTIENSYAAVKISSLLNIYIGGLISLISAINQPTTVNSYYNIDLCPDTTCAANLGLDYDRTTEQMVKQATFKGWDFTNTWAIDEGKSYPYFIGGKPYYPLSYIPNCTIDPIPSQTHTGSPITPSTKVACNGTTLTEDTDYTVSYDNNTNAGIATATITGIGSYTGTSAIKFTIALTVANASIDAIPNQTYNGIEQQPTLTVKDGLGKPMTLNTDYTVSYDDNINAGTATATITGIGNYTETKTIDFDIDILDISTAAIAAIPNPTYNGTDHQPAFALAGGTTLTKGDYTASYADNIDAGTATLTIEGTGNNCKGTQTIKFTIDPAPLAITGFSISKIFDGNNAVLGSLGTLSFTGFALGETANVDASGVTATYATVGANASIGITFTGAFAMDGGTANPANYAITPPSGIKGTIEPNLQIPDLSIEIAIKDNVGSNVFEKDSELSEPGKTYFRTSPSQCGIDKAPIQITIADTESELLVNGKPIKGEIDASGLRHSIDFPLSPKGGFDTLAFEIRKNGTSKEHSAIAITPISYEQLIVQRYSVLFVNNNPKSNGGYVFTEFKWFKNGEDINNPKQYYSGYKPDAKTNYHLDYKDVFNLEMKTQEGIKMSTCYGSPPEADELLEKAKSKASKQVLGINGKKAEDGAIIYNGRGERSDGTAPGVYIVK